MKFELLLFGITGLLIANTYYDGKYVQILKSWKKYYQMAAIGFAGLSLYVFLKKHPGHSKNMMQHAASIVKYIPIDKDSADLITPLFDMTNKSMFNPEIAQQGEYVNPGLSPQEKRMMNSGDHNATKRSVSETKKKFVAAQQSWKCNSCKKQLPAWFEVDHKIRLEHGGTNHIDNLVALCRDCHGKKTAMENF